MPRTSASRPAVELLYSAQGSLTEARQSFFPHDRYATAHLAALRTAAAVLADRAQVGNGSRRIRSAWEILPRVAPELTEWAEFFAAGARKRASAEAGIACVTTREADDLVRDAERFLAQVADSLGLVGQSTIFIEQPRIRHAN
jgi:hypothetical protein